jgi:pyruvate/2-oxoglutarate dehydrogenase complex dihydrolipoamide dehydrogenase (E3) component
MVLMDRKTIAVVGGGSAGFTAARAAARSGARVVLFLGDNAEQASLCVNQGCMPSKAMFEPIDAMHHAKAHGWLRVEPRRPEAYLAQIVAWKDREIARFRAYRQAAIERKDSEDFRVVRHNAHFVDANTLEANGERIVADRVILATGSTPILPPIEGLAELRDQIWGNEEILANTILPDSLIVIGGGAIALEFAQRYARLGCAVTLVVRSRILSGFPAPFGARIAEIYEREGIRVLLGARLSRITRDTCGWYVVQTEGAGGGEPVTGERVLLAVGRKPALDSLNLEAAGIERNDRGELDVTEQMRVAGHDHIFAAGDVVGRRLVVHLAHIEGGIAANNAVNDGCESWPRRANIQVVFSDPEFAFAGISADKAEAAGHTVITRSKRSRLVGKLHLAGDDLGFGEFMADTDTHRLLGAGLLCKDAGELIHLPAYAIEHEHTVHEAALAEYYHPTKMEIVSGIIDRLCKDLGQMPPRRARV